jgi:hypothetical protein
MARKPQPNPPKGSKEHERRMERQRARRAVDKKHTGSMTKTVNGKRVVSKSPKRDGKDVSHKKALSKGGSNKNGTFLEPPSKNRSRNYKNKK